MTTVILVASPIQIQGQPTGTESACFPVEPDAVTLMCTEGGPVGIEDVNSTSIENKSTSHTSESACFPVEPDAVTLMCTEGGPVGIEDVN